MDVRSAALRWYAAGMTMKARWAALGVLVLVCGSPQAHARGLARREPPRVDGPRLRILGTVQDGGLPHAGCSCPRCEADASGSAPDRHAASLALIATLDAEDRLDAKRRPEIHLIDATPDIRDQLRLLRDLGHANPGGVDRAPIDGVLLTHAHMGHYLGLAHLGFEALHARGVRVRATERMTRFLQQNQPWARLVELGEIEVIVAPAGKEFDLGGVRVTPVLVPHRDELSDTVAFVLAGARSRVLYMPDCDPWHRWEDRALELLSSVDVAILDATFFDGDELPGRDLSTIGHPLVVDTLALLGERVRRGDLRIILTHMNHTNPLLEEHSEARRRVLEAGVDIAIEGMEIGL